MIRSIYFVLYTLVILALLPSLLAARFTNLQKTPQRRTFLKKNDFGRILRIRNGSIMIKEKSEDDDDEAEEEAAKKERERVIEMNKVQRYRMEQQELLQLRSIFLGENLAKRGLPLQTRLEVSTKAGEKPPDRVDWDCAMSTNEEPKKCLISYDAEPGTKVIAPLGTDDWISLTALNRLRRTDPTKVDPMWHDKYAIIQSWFDDEASDYCILQHCGLGGLILAMVLKNPQESYVLKTLLISSISGMVLLLLPMFNYILNRMMVSSVVWMNWMNWARFVHAPFPLKFYLAQLAWKGITKALNKIEKRVRDFLIEVECTILEERLPLTIGPGSEEEDEELLDDDEDEEGDESDSSDYDD